VKNLKLTEPQVGEVDKVLQKYADGARALKRRNTKITKDEQVHVAARIGRYSAECRTPASNAVAELGGVVQQNILPSVRPGVPPRETFGDGGECRHEFEL